MIKRLLLSLLFLMPTPLAAQAIKPNISIDNVICEEGSGACDFVVRRHGRLNGKPSTAYFSTSDGTAKASSDYVAKTETVNFGAAETSKIVSVATVPSVIVEQAETFTGKLRAGANARCYDCTAVATITDPVPTVPTTPTTTTAEPPPVPDSETATTPTTEPLPPPPTVDPAPEPVASGYITSPTLEGLPKVSDGLVVSNYLNDLSKYGPTKSAGPDVVGAFRFVCYDAQASNDDPIVFPGQPGKAHGHQFYGNTGADASSTYASLRAAGESSCKNILNRSGYWAPRLEDDLYSYRADHSQIYYKRRPASDPKCSLTSGDPAAEGNCVQLPRGLRFVFGYDMVSGKTPTGSSYFMCSVGTWSGTSVAPTDTTHKANLQLAADICPIGARLSATLKAPGCWDGVYLDTPNHRDHVAYADYYNGVYKCPPTHPYVIAGFTLTRVWNVTPELKAAADAHKLRFSCDKMITGAVPGQCYHGDWFGAWNDEILDRWHANCINRLLNCADGELGDMFQLKEQAKTKFFGLPQRVPLP